MNYQNYSNSSKFAFLTYFEYTLAVALGARLANKRGNAQKRKHSGPTADEPRKRRQASTFTHRLYV